MFNAKAKTNLLLMKVISCLTKKVILIKLELYFLSLYIKHIPFKLSISPLEIYPKNHVIFCCLQEPYSKL